MANASSTNQTPTQVSRWVTPVEPFADQRGVTITVGERAPCVRLPHSACESVSGFGNWRRAGFAPQAWRVSCVQDRVFAEYGDRVGFSFPRNVQSQAAFRAWALSPQCPEKAVVTNHAGEVLIDMSPENLETHNLVKGEVSSALLALIRQSRQGTLYFDGCLLTIEKTGLTTVPDAIFVTKESFRSRKVQLVPSKHDSATHSEMLGVPDWVLEVVSPTSEEKDKVLLRSAYYEAGIGEYWIVDARAGEPELNVLLRGKAEYENAAAEDGWQKSPMFGRSFQLTREHDEDGFLYWELHGR